MNTFICVEGHSWKKPLAQQSSVLHLHQRQEGGQAGPKGGRGRVMMMIVKGPVEKTHSPQQYFHKIKMDLANLTVNLATVWLYVSDPPGN